MNPDEHHLALPKLYGAPAYARPPRVFEVNDRPPDPDDLPLEADRDDEALALAPAPVEPPADDSPAHAPLGEVPSADAPGVEPEIASAREIVDPVETKAETEAGAATGSTSPSPFSVRALGRIIPRR